MARQESNRREVVKLSDAASFLLDECRMVLPGIQAIFGFQLIAIFNQRFSEDLAEIDQQLHFVALTLLALAVAIIMSPAAYHRITGITQVTERFLRNSSRLMLASMVALALGLSLDYYVVGRLVFSTPWVAAGGATLFGVMAFFWFVLPASRRAQEILDRLPESGAPTIPSKDGT